MVPWFVSHLLFKNLELMCVCHSPEYNLPVEAAGRHTDSNPSTLTLASVSFAIQQYCPVQTFLTGAREEVHL